MKAYHGYVEQTGINMQAVDPAPCNCMDAVNTAASMCPLHESLYHITHTIGAYGQDDVALIPSMTARTRPFRSFLITVSLSPFL